MILARDFHAYSSVYLDEEPRVMGESTQVAIQFYVQAGLNPNKENKEPPDHISTELEFTYYLLFRFLENGDQRHQELAMEFLQNHLIPWVPDFTTRVIENTTLPFYKTIAQLLEQFIRLEQE